MIRWTFRCHNADAGNSPLREDRLTWKKIPKRKKDEGAAAAEEEPVILKFEGFRGTGGNEQLPSPIEQIVGDTKRRILDEASFLEKMQRAAERQKLEEFFSNEERRKEILSTLSEKYSLRDAVKVKKWLEQGETKGVRDTLQRLFSSRIEPEKDAGLQKAIKEEKGKEGTATKPGNWQEWKERIALLGNRHYNDLAAFMANPVVRELHGFQSPLETFRALSDPARRQPLLQELATTRHALVFEGVHRLTERREALHHLAAFLEYSQELLPENERIAFLDSYTRVQACRVALDEYAASLEGKGEETQGADRSLYAAKAAQIVGFFKEDRESSNRSLGSKSGQPGLIKRLENAGKRSGAAVPAPRSSTKSSGVGNVFDILADGLKKGGWIAELSVPETLKYTCTLIALEEIGYVYVQIAAGRMEPLEPAALQERVKKFVLEALRRGVRGTRENDTVPFASSALDPKRAFESLRAKIASTPNPTNEEVNELLLLFEWLKYRGEAPEGITRGDIQKLRAKVEVSTRELRERVERSREALPLIAESGAIRSALFDHLAQVGERVALRNVLKDKIPALWMRYQGYVAEQAKERELHAARLRENAYTMCTFIEEKLSEEEQRAVAEVLIHLKKSDLRTRLAMLYGAEEERRLYEEAKEALRKLASPSLKQEDRPKLAHRASRDPETLRAALDQAYLQERRKILESTFLQENEREKRLAALDKAYEDEIGMRQELHLTRIAEWQTILLSALEAEMRLRARELQETYVEGLGDGRINRVSKKMSKGDQEAFWDMFLIESDMVRVLREREREDLRNDPHGTSAAETDLEQLQDFSEIAKHPLSEAMVLFKDAQEGQQAAQTLLASDECRAAPEVARRNIQEYASGAILPGPGMTRKIKMLKEDPALAARAAEEHERIERKAGAIDNVDAKVLKLERELQEVQREAQSAIALYQPRSDDYGYTELSYGLPIILEERHYAAIRGKLHQASKPEFPREEAKRLLAEVENELERLRAFAVTLKKSIGQEPEVLDEVAFASFQGKEMPRDAWGGFDQKMERIVLRKKILEKHPSAKAAILAEERAHALNIAVVKHLNPRFFLDVFNTIFEKNSPRIQSLFRQWAEKRFGSAPEITSEDYRQWRHEVAEELMAKLSLFYQFGGLELDAEKKPAHLPLSREDIRLFQELHRTGAKILPTKDDPEWHPRLRKVAASQGDDDYDDILSPSPIDVGAGQGPTGVREVGEEEPRPVGREAAFTGQEPGTDEGPPAKNGYVEGSRISENLANAKKALIKAKAFLKAYPDHGPHTADNKAYVAELEAEYNTLSEDFTKKESERDEALKRRAQALSDNFDRVVKEISDFDFRQEDLRQVPPVGRGLTQIWKGIEWLSINDVIRIFKDIAEDIKRQYNRRQEGKIGRVGEMITAWISPKVPYLGNLHHDFHERKQKAELEEVEHFKKGLANVDAFEIQFMTHHTTNKDFLKACIIELTDRGRMNWNDTEMWATFNKLSRFEMPIKECERNENLREAWLRKIISDIWEDKDNYRNWKRKNDSEFDSKMKEYTFEADRLSNIGGLPGELEKQLRVYTETVDYIEKTGKHVPMEETVRRDLYWEIIDYSIRNGKMTMEQKFYYIVQGLASGLIPLDRLGILAGEKGDILQIFPFIDYFYQRNNTMPELQALADRLRETTNKKDPQYYKPGLRTTLWLELEVAREDSVQKRLSKGADRRAGDMDHDDMHFFVPRLSSDEILSMAAPRGGGLQKVTSQGWNNAYSGYNSFFKSFGMLTKLEEDKEVGAKISSRDVDQVLRAVSGFIHMDAALTGQSKFGEARRPTLNFGDMRARYSVVSDGSKTIYEERKLVTEFARKVLDAYTDDRELTRQFIEAMFIDTENRNPTEDEDKQLAKNARLVEQLLRKAVEKQGTAKLKRLLGEYAERFTSHAGKKFNYSNVKEKWRESAAQRKDTAQATPRPAP